MKVKLQWYRPSVFDPNIQVLDLNKHFETEYIVCQINYSIVCQQLGP